MLFDLDGIAVPFKVYIAIKYTDYAGKSQGKIRHYCLKNNAIYRLTIYVCSDKITRLKVG